MIDNDNIGNKNTRLTFDVELDLAANTKQVIGIKFVARQLIKTMGTIGTLENQTKEIINLPRVQTWLEGSIRLL